MGVPAVGAGRSADVVKHAVVTVLAFVGLSYFLYGPPLTAGLAAAAHDECNSMTGSSYRNYELQWRTTTFGAIDVPHWVCRDLRDATDTGTDLGWWVDL